MGTSRWARELWRVFEPVHALYYWAPEARAATDRLGLAGYWMGYFGSRAAPLGTVPAEVVAATFYGFHVDMVRRAVPQVWARTTPVALLEARSVAVDAAMHRVFGAEVCGSAQVRRAADLCGEAVALAEYGGRPLGAANAILPVPDEPHLALWQATTTLREHRGDGHIAALVTEGLSPVESLVSASAAGGASRQDYLVFRRWSEEEWAAGVAGLQKRGWLDAAGRLTDAGRAGRGRVEAVTDQVAEHPWLRLGADRADEVRRLLEPLAREVFARGAIPQPNPVGIVAP